MNKMLLVAVKAVAVSAVAMLVLSSCSKQGLSASKTLKRDAVSSEVAKSVEHAEVEAPATIAESKVAIADAQPEVKASQKVVKKNLIERTAEKVVTKKIEKYLAKHPEMQKKYEAVQGLDANLKMALIFFVISILCGVVGSLFSGDVISWIFWVAGLVTFVIGCYYLILWLLSL